MDNRMNNLCFRRSISNSQRFQDPKLQGGQPEGGVSFSIIARVGIHTTVMLALNATAFPLSLQLARTRIGPCCERYSQFMIVTVLPHCHISFRNL